MSATKQLKLFEYVSLSEKGDVRDENQDRCGYFNTVNGDLFVLCDGMGSTQQGGLAAELTVNYIKTFFEEEWKNKPFDLIEKAIAETNKYLFKSLIEFNNPNTGTTLVLLLIRESSAYYAHVGDSRIYYKTAGKIFQVTKDHSFVQNLLNKGLITQKEAKEHPRRNEITKALGISEYVEPEICSKELVFNDDDHLLLCSDGLSSYIEEKHINRILNSNKTLDEKAKELKEKAEDNGSDDNISFQIIKFYNTGRQVKRKRKAFFKNTFFQIGFILLTSALIFYFVNKRFTTEKQSSFKPENQHKEEFYFTKTFTDDALFVYNQDDKSILKRTKYIYLKSKYTMKTEYLSIIINCSEINLLQVNKNSNFVIKPGKKYIIPEK